MMNAEVLDLVQARHVSNRWPDYVVHQENYYPGYARPSLNDHAARVHMPMNNGLEVIEIKCIAEVPHKKQDGKDRGRGLAPGDQGRGSGRGDDIDHVNLKEPMESEIRFTLSAPRRLPEHRPRHLRLGSLRRAQIQAGAIQFHECEPGQEPQCRSGRAGHGRTDSHPPRKGQREQRHEGNKMAKDLGVRNPGEVPVILAKLKVIDSEYTSYDQQSENQEGGAGNP